MDIINYLNKASLKSHFERIRFNNDNLPTDINKICIVPFFGDLRSLFIFSCFILNKFKIENKSSKYLIVCSWPGFECMFPYADEYWSFNDKEEIDDLYLKTNFFYNNSSKIFAIYRSLNSYFEDVLFLEEDFINKYYNFGFSDLYIKKYKNITVTFPEIPSSVSLGKYFNRDLNNQAGYKIFVHPSYYLNTSKFDNISKYKISKDFWIELIKKLIENNFVPIIYKGIFTYDLSEYFNKNCIHLKDDNFSKCLSAMRSSSCVLDVFNDISRYAIASRSAFFCVNEKSLYFKNKEYEIDDLFMSFLQKKYLFSFSNILESNKLSGINNLFDLLINRLKDFLPEIDRDKFYPTNELTKDFSYDVVRKNQIKKMGINFLKLPKI